MKIYSIYKNMRNKRIWLWFIVLALLATIVFIYISHLQSQKTANFLSESVTRGDIENTVTAIGKFQPIKKINVAAQVSGQLKSVFVKIGDSVKENQLIAEIDPSSIRTKVEISRAQLDELQAQLVNKQAQLVLKQVNSNRLHRLFATHAVSQSNVDQANAELAEANADVKALRAKIKMQEATLSGDTVNLSYTHIYTPMAGIVIDQTAKEGETVNAVQSAPTIVTIADLSMMTVQAQVSEADVGKLKVGMPVYFTLLGQPDKRFTGTLRQIRPKPETTNNVVLYDALFDIHNPDGKFMIDRSAQVDFILESAKNVLIIPSAALHTKPNANGEQHQTYVNIITAAGELKEQPVEVGIRNRVLSEIKNGVQEGDKVIVSSETNSKPESNNEVSVGI